VSYLLDTNIICETVKLRPNTRVLKWLDGIPSEKLYVSVLTIGEIKKGIELLDDDKKRNELEKWLEHSVYSWFGNNLLSINLEVAEKWGYLNATNKQLLPSIDGLIAATALTYNLKLVTRNEKDFLIKGLEIVNPFSS
jgi:hypothetical protein